MLAIAGVLFGVLSTLNLSAASPISSPQVVPANSSSATANSSSVAAGSKQPLLYVFKVVNETVRFLPDNQRRVEISLYSDPTPGWQGFGNTTCRASFPQFTSGNDTFYDIPCNDTDVRLQIQQSEVGNAKFIVALQTYLSPPAENYLSWDSWKPSLNDSNLKIGPSGFTLTPKHKLQFNTYTVLSAF